MGEICADDIRDVRFDMSGYSENDDASVMLPANSSKVAGISDIGPQVEAAMEEADRRLWSLFLLGISRSCLWWENRRSIIGTASSVV